MKKLLLALLSLCALHATAQITADYAVVAEAAVNPAPPTITLQWIAHPSATEYRIYKKEPDESSWGTVIATLDAASTSYTDTDVAEGVAYEYKIMRDMSSGITAEGYILSGILMELPEYRGTCLLVIDTTITATLSNEIYRLKEDISGDGWSVRELHVARDMSPIAVREQIIAYAEADTTLEAILLLGRVPVLYSGNLYPDGHPDHQGAWPSDGIYGDIDAEYTDDFTDVTVATRPENWNVPGDGKYDQNIFKSKLELQVGRVDMYNLPSFGLDEAVLLKRYLDNDHAYRVATTKFTRRALIDDNFGAFGGEAFAASGWRNFGPLCGSETLLEADYFYTMRDSSYVWSYGCGGGWYQGASGVGSTTDFTTDTTKAVFTMLFGSYFGDWDVTDNFLRAPLAGGTALTNAWAGRPHWHFHRMGLGETIGQAARLTQNNSTTYVDNIFPKWVHIALMGDPTLRMYPVPPVEDVICTVENAATGEFQIDIVPGTATDLIGYHVYRATERFGRYERITDTPVTLPMMSNAIDGGVVYNYFMVRPVTIIQTPSGSLYNEGTGVVDSMDIILDVAAITPSATRLFPNPADAYIDIESAYHEAQPYTIVSSSGQWIQTGILTNGACRINTIELPEGLYLIYIGGTVLKFSVIHP